MYIFLPVIQFLAHSSGKRDKTLERKIRITVNQPVDQSRINVRNKKKSYVLSTVSTE